jgi:hypothetical protein
MGIYRNLGAVDACIRGVLAVAVVIVAGVFNSHPGISLGAALIALVLIVTALMRYCPIYRLLGINTAREHSSPQT